MRQAVISIAVLLALGCGPLNSNPGDKLRVELKGALESIQKMVLEQRIAPVELTFAVHECEAFDAYVVSGTAEQRRQAKLSVEKASDGTYRALTSVESLRPVGACSLLEGKDAQAWLEVTCTTDGRSGKSDAFSFDYRASKFDYMGADLQSIFPGRTDGAFWALSRSGYMTKSGAFAFLGGDDASDVFGRFIFPAPSGSGFIGVLEQVGASVHVTQGTESRDVEGFGAVSSDGFTRFVLGMAANPRGLIAFRTWQGEDFVIGETGSVRATQNGSTWEPVVTITRIDPGSALNQEWNVVQAFLNEELLGVSRGTAAGAPVLLTVDRGTKGMRLRSLDGTVIALTTAQVTVTATKANPYRLADDGSAWAFGDGNGPLNQSIFVQKHSGGNISAAVKLNTTQARAFAFLSDGALAVGDGEGLEIFAAPNFTSAEAHALAKNGEASSVTFVIPLADAAMAVMTNDGVQLEQVTRVGARQVAVAHPNGIYVFEMSDVDVAP